MLKLNLLVILGLCCLINTLPVKKSRLFAFPAFRHLRVRNTTTSETMETTVEASQNTTAEPLEARLYELAKRMGVPYTRPDVGIRLFGYKKPAAKMDRDSRRKSFKRPDGGRRKFVQLWPQKADATTKKVDKEEAGNATTRKTDKEEAVTDRVIPRRGSDGGDGAYPKELTLNLPHMTKDLKKGWVYNPWGVTFGHPLMDTRFAQKSGAEGARYRVNEPEPKYDPTAVEGISTVCLGRSTIYNSPKVFWWLQRLVHNVSFDRRTLWMDLRWELFWRGRSEECHTLKYTDFREFQECNLKRHQRIEYLIPQYPMHQIGYRKYYQRGSGEDDDR